MNKKKIMNAGILIVVFVIGAGGAYYFDPGAINKILGINSAQVDAIPAADLFGADDTSSSLPTAIPDGSEVSLAPAGGKVPQKTAQGKMQEKNSAGASGVAAAQTAISSTQAATPEQSAAPAPTEPAADISDDLPVPAVVTTSIQSAAALPPCAFPASVPSTTRKIILNEIAWMGTPSSSSAEWMELKNISAGAVDLSGWELLNASGKIKLLFSAGDAIPPGGLLLLARGTTTATDGAAVPTAKIYSGDLVNTGDVLALMDPQCTVSDYLDASAGWPGGNNSTKQTLERDADGIGWHSSALPGGTPGAENSAGPPPVQYKLTIAFEGSAGGATIASVPAGLVCGVSCMGSYASGTRITLTPAAGLDSAFSGWSGSCSGETVCSLTLMANTSLTAEFRSTLSVQTGGSVDSGSGSASGTSGGSSDSTSTDTDISSISTGVATSSEASSTSADGTSGGTGAATGHILISAVQIGGASSSNDLVKLYNPTAAPVDMSGWKLHKKSQTGTDYSLKVFPAGSTIAAGQSFVWANSTDGFSETVGANVSSTETLSADNSVALMDAAGNIIDAVAWGTGDGQYGEGPPYPTSPGASQLLSRRSSGGMMVDTDDNTNDFTLQ